MFTHLFRLTWNKKKQNFLLLLEIFFSFIGLFAGFTLMLYPYNNKKLPLGFEDENVWVVNFTEEGQLKSIDSLQVFRESVKSALLSINGVEDVTYSSKNIPFSGNGFGIGVGYNGKKTWGSLHTVEDNYANILGVKVLEGRWFSGDDVISKEKPVVINEALKLELFGEENALGKMIETDAANGMKIVGVVTSFKEESEAERPAQGLFIRMDTGNMRDNIAMMVKVKPGADIVLESRVYKTLSNTMKNANVEIEHLTDMKTTRNKAMRVPLFIIIIIASFLIINVALGIFGVLWYNINKRRGEIGLRRAVGATGNGISKQLVGEALLLSTLSIIVGLFFAVQFPLLSALQLPVANYVQAIFLSVCFVYVLVILCALYPGKQAATIYPAVALHED
jgi:putative ABC transport system permease protein